MANQPDPFRWNVIGGDASEGRILICEGDHHRSESCDNHAEPYVREGKLLEAQREIAELKAELERARQIA